MFAAMRIIFRVWANHRILLVVHSLLLKNAFDKIEFARECASAGKVVGVVRKPGDPNTHYYMFYNHVKYRTTPSVGSHDWFYKECGVMMSNQEKTRKIVWDVDKNKRSNKTKTTKPNMGSTCTIRCESVIQREI